MAARLAPEWVRTIAGICSHEAAGESREGVYVLVATFEANGVNPEAYLTDALLRVQAHPNWRIGELLPQEWTRGRAADASRARECCRARSPSVIKLSGTTSTGRLSL